MEAHSALLFYELWSLSATGAEIIDFITICIGDAIIVSAQYVVLDLYLAVYRSTACG